MSLKIPINANKHCIVLHKLVDIHSKKKLSCFNPNLGQVQTEPKLG